MRSNESKADTSLQVVLQRLRQEKVRSYDTETSGLDFRFNHVVGHVLAFTGDPRDSYYVPFRHLGNANVGGRPGPNTATGWDGLPAPGEAELIDALDQQGALNFGHNLNFDLRFLWRLGMRKLQARNEDTMINAALLDEWQPKFSLEYCCNQAGVAAKKSEQISAYLCSKFPEASADPKNAMAHFWRLAGDDPVAIEYATGDGTSTWQLRDWQMKELEKQELLKVHDIESRLIPVLARMSGVGIKIDQERLEFLLSDKEGSVAYQIARLMEQFPTDFNFRSPNDVKKWCTDHGQTGWPFTPGRLDRKTNKRTPAPSFPGSWLETHEPGKKIVMVRKLATLRDSFLKPMQETHLWNGRVHTTFHQLRDGEYGTPTGRLSSSDPNLQAVSKHDEFIGALHRSIFVPDEGKVWANADYSQIEPRLLAYYGQIPVLLDGYHADPPVDAHTSASKAMNRNWPNMTDKERKQYRNNIGKRINQTIITGGGPGVLVEKYGVPASEAKQAFRDYHAAMPELKVLQVRSAKVFRTRGYVLSLLGRRARFGPDRRDYVAVNRLLQVGNADLVKTKLVELDDYLKSEGRPVDLINTIHDDIAFQFPESARVFYSECLRIMTDFSPGQTIELDIPITVDAGEGTSWSEATFGTHK